MDSYVAALNASYEKEVSAEVLGQPFQWRKYPTPVNMGHAYADPGIKDWDRSDPIGFLLSYHNMIGNVTGDSDFSKMASYWEDSEAKLRQIRAYYNDPEKSFLADSKGNKEIRDRWYAVADVVFEDGDAGVLQVTYYDDGRVRGGSFSRLVNVDGLYRFEQEEGMRASKQREILLDYLGLQDDGK